MSLFTPTFTGAKVTGLMASEEIDKDTQENKNASMLAQVGTCV